MRKIFWYLYELVFKIQPSNELEITLPWDSKPRHVEVAPGTVCADFSVRNVFFMMVKNNSVSGRNMLLTVNVVIFVVLLNDIPSPECENNWS